MTNASTLPCWQGQAAKIKDPPLTPPEAVKKLRCTVPGYSGETSPRRSLLGEAEGSLGQNPVFSRFKSALDPVSTGETNTM